MSKEKKLSRIEVAQYLKEALQIFCDPLKELRPALAEPFRQNGYVCASDGNILIRINAMYAGCGIRPFPKMDKFDVNNPVPPIGFKELTKAKLLRLGDIRHTVKKLKKYEEEHGKVAMADLGGVKLNINSLSRMEKAMTICGANVARLVWHQDYKVMLQLYNDKHNEAVTILLAGMGGLDGTEHIVNLQTYQYSTDLDVSFDWKKGMAAWKKIKEEMERKEEEERMARREVYLVEVVKRAYLPVYAKNAEEAEAIADEHFIDPEDDGDEEWMIGNRAPQAENLDILDECYEHVLTRDGVVERERIYEMEQVIEEWHKKH